MRSQDRGGKQTVSARVFTAVGPYVAAECLDLEKTVLYRQGVALTELRVTWMGDCWRVMLKGRRKGKGIITYIFCKHFDDALEYTTYFADNSELSWTDDRFPVEW